MTDTAFSPWCSSEYFCGHEWTNLTQGFNHPPGSFLYQFLDPLDHGHADFIEAFRRPFAGVFSVAIHAPQFQDWIIRQREFFQSQSQPEIQQAVKGGNTFTLVSEWLRNMGLHESGSSHHGLGTSNDFSKSCTRICSAYANAGNKGRS